MAVLLTGATGFLGMELLARYLERSDRRVHALVRASNDDDAAERLRGVIENVCGDREAHRDRWSAVAGDIEAPGLGIAPQRRRALARDVSDVIHSAATVSFSLPLEESRRTNVRGTRRLLEFAELCRLHGGIRRFAHVSTAYVAGDHEGTFAEDQLEVGQGFRNSYERSKFEAERLVLRYTGVVPVQIFRPSIIVGEERSGWTDSFNVLYPPLRAFHAGALKVLPARRSTPVDVVPVDFVADAIFELVNQDARPGEIHHLVAGRRATSLGRIAERASRFFERPVPRLVPPRLYRLLIHPMLLRLSSGRRRQTLRRTEGLLPYFTMGVRFDDRRASSRLERAGIRAPAPESYLDRLLAFAVAAGWGRNPISRAEALRSASS